MSDLPNTHEVLDTTINEFRKTAHLILEAMSRAETPQRHLVVSVFDDPYFIALEQAVGLMDVYWGQIKSVCLTPSVVETLRKRNELKVAEVNVLIEQYRLEQLQLLVRGLSESSSDEQERKDG